MITSRDTIQASNFFWIYEIYSQHKIDLDLTWVSPHHMDFRSKLLKTFVF